MRIRYRLLLVLLPLMQVSAGVEAQAGTMPDPRLAEAITLMDAFAGRTAGEAGTTPRRYLWTDAFAVCNYLGLARATGNADYTQRARRLIDAVHHTLGRHREDDPRTGWISGLDAEEGERHPTRGGLRIGKPLPERGLHEPYDNRLEWERDGQYFHYLTKWMIALDQAARATREPHYNRWARELAATAFRAFSYLPFPGGGTRRMYWKMSIDLERPLVPSMGQHDPLDGYVSNLQLQATAAALPQAPGGPDLEHATRQYARMLRGAAWATADPLGLGELLVAAWRVQQLRAQGAVPVAQLPERLLEAAYSGLQHYSRDSGLTGPADQRLAFRELGLAIGLHAARRMHLALQGATAGDTRRLQGLLHALLQYLPLRDEIEDFWRDPEHRRGATWLEHQDINEVMLATSLAPAGFLELLPLE